MKASLRKANLLGELKLLYLKMNLVIIKSKCVLTIAKLSIFILTQTPIHFLGLTI